MSTPTTVPIGNFVDHLDMTMAHHRAFIWWVLERLQQLDPTALRRDSEGYAIWQGAVPGKPAASGNPVALALPLVQEFEGCKLRAYPDPGTGGEPWTIGWGSTSYSDGRPVQQGDTITQTEADDLLSQRLERDCKVLAGRIPRWGELNAHQQAALLSFSYNVGVNWYGSEGFATITARIRDWDLAGVPAAMLLYVNPGTPVEMGLRRRRKAEGKLFTSGGPAPAAAAPAASSEWAARVRALNLSQPDSSTCQATCIAMAVRDPDIPAIRRKLVNIGSAGDPAVMRRVIQSYNVKYEYDGNASLEKVYGWLKAGELLITHGWFTGSGHVICLDGLKQKPDGSHDISVKDPWSKFDAGSWRYKSSEKFYDGPYSDRVIYAACVAGAGAGDARRIYQSGTFNAKQGGMWVHRFLV